MVLAGGEILLAAAMSVAWAAGFPVTLDKTCPVGGKTFKYTTTGSYSTWGSRPDGKPYGSWQFPLAMPDCPDNRLVMYRDFSKAELPALERLVRSDDYRALAGDTDYYRAQWLHTRLGGDEREALWMLVSATWQPEPGSAQRKRYLEELVARVSAIPAPAVYDDLEAVVLRIRAANALRELGRFEEAAAAADAVRIADNATAKDMDAGDAEKARAGWRQTLVTLSEVARKRNASAEPFDLVPEMARKGLCEHGADRLSAEDRRRCASLSE